jgi:RNA polymerase-binding transcription factor DksA
MAKKAQKAKPAKKAAKPAKKAVAKPAKPVKKAAKPAKPAKKAAPKKVAKPVKKVAPKKAAKPAKKVAPKKVAKVVKKVVAKKVSKPAKKAVSKPVAKKAAKPAKKIVSKPVVKKAAKPAKVAKVVAKPAPKAVVKPIAKAVVKPVSKVVAKPVVAKVEPKKVVVAPKPVAVVAKKVEPKNKQDVDLDDDGGRMSDEPMVVEYKTPSIQRPMGPVPKPHINTDVRTRYNDSELKEFKQLILKKLEEARKDFELLKSTLSHKDDHGTDDTSPTFKLLEDGSDVLSKEETAHLASRQEKFIQNLQNALIRIENKTYGICRATGKLISKERLRSVPHATLAIEAKLEQHN